MINGPIVEFGAENKMRYMALTVDLFTFCREHCVSIEIIPDPYDFGTYIIYMTSRKNPDRLTGMRYETQMIINMDHITYSQLLMILEKMAKQLDDFIERKEKRNDADSL